MKSARISKGFATNGDWARSCAKTLRKFALFGQIFAHLSLTWVHVAVYRHVCKSNLAECQGDCLLYSATFPMLKSPRIRLDPFQGKGRGSKGSLTLNVVTDIVTRRVCSYPVLVPVPWQSEIPFARVITTSNYQQPRRQSEIPSYLSSENPALA